VAAAIAAQLDRLEARALDPGLYIVATPIGHLADVTVRALSTLAKVDRILCEDTRHSRTLLDAYGVTTRLSPYHEHNAETVRPEVLAALAAGDRIALVSDAGTPLVSDPGYKLVRAAIDAGHRVFAVPGASAVLAALTIAGLPTDAFHFAGFLPAKSAARRTALADLAAARATLVLFEAPGRVADLVADIAAVLGEREVVVVRELTKLHESRMAGPAAQLAAELAAAPPRGECVVLIGAASHANVEIDDAALTAALTDALQSLSPSAAARFVAAKFAVPKRRVYDLMLTLTKDQAR
jgi:16S rRNA (cytidine1402-2'-O)-methyltransferase